MTAPIGVTNQPFRPEDIDERTRQFTGSIQDVQQGLLDFLLGRTPQTDISQLLQPTQFPQELFTPGASALQQQAFQQAGQIQPFSPQASNALFQQGVADPAIQNFQSQILPQLAAATLPTGQTGAQQGIGASAGRGLARDLAAQQAQFQVGQQQFGAQQLSQLANLGGLQRAISGQQAGEEFGRFQAQQPGAAPGLQLLSSLTGNLLPVGGFEQGFNPASLGSLFGVGSGGTGGSLGGLGGLLGGLGI